MLMQGAVSGVMKRSYVQQRNNGETLKHKTAVNVRTDTENSQQNGAAEGVVFLTVQTNRFRL